MNKYPIFDLDIAPKGFRVIAFHDYISERTVQAAETVLADPRLAEVMAEHNYAIVCAHYSYTMLEQQLRGLLDDLQRDKRMNAYAGFSAVVTSAPASNDESAG